MQGLLEGKVAVITGAGSGVGRAAVKLWAEHGAKIIAADINVETAEESVRLAGAPQGQIKAVQCNVADPDSVDAAVALAVETFGRLDVIYNNAGITVNPVPGVGLRKLVELPHEIGRQPSIEGEERDAAHDEHERDVAREQLRAERERHRFVWSRSETAELRRITQPVAEPMHGLDRLAVCGETLTKPANVRVDGPRVRLGADPPDLLQELRP